MNGWVPPRLSDLAPDTAVQEHADAYADLPDRGPWQPLDLAALKDRPKPQPTIGRPKGSNLGLLYRGRKHLIHGLTGCGKSWVALHLADDAARQGARVVWIDMEDVAQSFVYRLGVVAKHGGYQDFDRYLTAWDFIEKPAVEATAADIAALVEPCRRVGLVVLDGVTDYASLHGWDTESGTDMAVLGRHLDAMAATGAAVLMLDASPKNGGGDPAYSIGSQHKGALVNGSSFLVKGDDDGFSFSPSEAGAAGLVYAKDRPGGLPGRRGQRVAELRYHPRTGFALTGLVQGWRS